MNSVKFRGVSPDLFGGAGTALFKMDGNRENGGISLLDNFLAEKFIKKAGESTEYNINIMDEKGVIIASKDAERIGNFHEVAYWIIHGDEEIIDVPDGGKYLGVKPGVMLPIVHRGKRTGAIGVTGEPDEVRDIAKVMKFAIETMYEFESQHELSARRRSMKERFIYGILSNEVADIEKLKEDAETLGWDESCVRLPVLLFLDEMADVPTVLRKLKESALYSRQDIISVVQDKNVIIFKSFKPDTSSLCRYKEIIAESIASCKNYLDMAGADYQFLVGTFQNRFEKYRIGYQHCIWMRDRVKEQISYFYEHVNEYMKSLIAMVEYRDIYGVYEQLLDEKGRENILEVVESLQKNNYNFNASSKELYIHKNTLVFRFNKIRELLGVNPMQQVADREFLEYLHYFVKNNRT